MELQAFEVQGLEMASLVNVIWVIVSVISQLFQVSQMGFERVLIT